MNITTILIELLLGGFFAVACVKAHEPLVPGQKMTLADFFSLSDRVERLKRSRWQWFSMVFLMLIIRLQGHMPLMLEMMVVAEFVLFVALPVQARTTKRASARGINHL
jgi:hypothetical protein